MDSMQIYVAVAIIVLAVIWVLVSFKNKSEKEKKLSKLAAIAFAFVLAGIIFGEDRVVGYLLMGIGVFLAVIDIVMKSRKK